MDLINKESLQQQSTEYLSELLQDPNIETGQSQAIAEELDSRWLSEQSEGGDYGP